MSRVPRLAILLAAGAAAGWILSPRAPAIAQGIREVFVLNWPDVQKVSGAVTVQGPVRLASMVALEDLVVGPVARSRTTRLLDAGTLDLDGYGHVVLSLLGQTKGQVVQRGVVGAILIPDHETVLEAFFQRGETLFALSVEAEAREVSPYLASAGPRSEIAFPRYRVFLWNATDKSAQVALYAYRTP